MIVRFVCVFDYVLASVAWLIARFYFFTESLVTRDVVRRNPKDTDTAG